LKIGEKETIVLFINRFIPNSNEQMLSL